MCRILLLLPLSAALFPMQIAGADTRTRDRLVANRVEMHLARSGGLRDSRVQVTADAGVVTLDGVVGTEQAKARAVRIASRTRGVDRSRTV